MFSEETEIGGNRFLKSIFGVSEWPLPRASDSDRDIRSQSLGIMAAPRCNCCFAKNSAGGQLGSPKRRKARVWRQKPPPSIISIRLQQTARAVFPSGIFLMAKCIIARNANDCNDFCSDFAERSRSIGWHVDAFCVLFVLSPS
jgi:hypothetical protein